MDVSIKNFDVEMKIKNRGVELAVSEPSGGAHLGNLVLTKSKIIWCRGKTQRKNGVALTWSKFIAQMEDDT